MCIMLYTLLDITFLSDTGHDFYVHSLLRRSRSSAGVGGKNSLAKEYRRGMSVKFKGGMVSSQKIIQEDEAPQEFTFKNQS